MVEQKRLRSYKGASKLAKAWEARLSINAKTAPIFSEAMRTKKPLQDEFSNELVDKASGFDSTNIA